jgi:hypothetical protein
MDTDTQHEAFHDEKNPPFKDELTVVWASEKAAILDQQFALLERIQRLETLVSAIQAALAAKSAKASPGAGIGQAVPKRKE